MNSKLNNINSLLEKSSFDGIILNPGETLKYITGLDFHLMERPVLLFITKHFLPLFILPELEKGKLSQLKFDYQFETYSDEKGALETALGKVSEKININETTFCVESTKFRFLETEFINNSFPNIHLRSADEFLQDLRICKSNDELEKVSKAITIAENALKETIKIIKIDVSENDIANELTYQLIKAGSSIDLPFPPIVASGPNSANPHAAPSNRKLKSEDMLIIDWGARFQGYASDITRTFAIGSISDEMKNIYQIVKLANQSARDAARSNIPAKLLDKSARVIINAAGYEKEFMHRTGHGLGLEAHEYPYITSENSYLLKPGNLFTIEPGIYLKGIGGVRIEDDVVITSNGSETLTSLNRDLFIIE